VQRENNRSAEIALECMNSVNIGLFCVPAQMLQVGLIGNIFASRFSTPVTLATKAAILTAIRTPPMAPVR
jgi:hypothetical protein